MAEQAKRRGGKSVEVEDDPKLIETDNEEDKPLIRQIKKVAACNRAESEARDASQQARLKLIELMQDRGLQTYRHGRHSATLKHLDKVSVKTDDENGEDE